MKFSNSVLLFCFILSKALFSQVELSKIDSINDKYDLDLLITTSEYYFDFTANSWKVQYPEKLETEYSNLVSCLARRSFGQRNYEGEVIYLNEDWEICAYGYFKNGEPHGFFVSFCKDKVACKKKKNISVQIYQYRKGKLINKTEAPFYLGQIE